ncbi:cytochrome C [bacterium]|nr:cytochrome C [bacterium]
MSRAEAARAAYIVPILALCALVGCLKVQDSPPQSPDKTAQATVIAGTSPLPPDGNLLFVGPEICRDCHSKQFDKWSKSAHSRSYQPLVKRGDQNATECLRCHTTGFFERSGFIDIESTPHLAAVTCEACHGPGSAHVQARRMGDDDPEYGNVSCAECQLARICILCHRSADFDAKSRVKKLGCTGGH